MSQQSHLEDLFARQLDEAGIAYERQTKAIPHRRFAFDFYIREANLLIEIQGGTWNGGRHVTGVGFRKDCEKFNLATILGFRILKADNTQTKSGELLEWTKKAIVSTGKPTPQPDRPNQMMELF